MEDAKFERPSTTIVKKLYHPKFGDRIWVVVPTFYDIVVDEISTELVLDNWDEYYKDSTNYDHTCSPVDSEQQISVEPAFVDGDEYFVEKGQN